MCDPRAKNKAPASTGDYKENYAIPKLDYFPLSKPKTDLWLPLVKARHVLWLKNLFWLVSFLSEDVDFAFLEFIRCCNSYFDFILLTEFSLFMLLRFRVHL